MCETGVKDKVSPFVKMSTYFYVVLHRDVWNLFL